ncbi:DsbA family protein [Escherichia albertii]|nr:DsbA family protein [Escherichia albertii]
MKALLFCGLGIACMPKIPLAAVPKEGKDYTVLKASVAGAPSVVEFFSFYCPPCAAFSSQFQVSQAVEKILPSGEKVMKYHVSTMGPMGPVLTEACIRQVFIDTGISGRDYDAAKNSMTVRALTAKQQEAARAYGVTGTPSFFVKGKYLVNNGAIQPSSEQDYGKSFADVVSALLK